MWGPKIVCGGAIIGEKSVTILESNILAMFAVMHYINCCFMPHYAQNTLHMFPHNFSVACLLQIC